MGPGEVSGLGFWRSAGAGEVQRHDVVPGVVRAAAHVVGGEQVLLVFGHGQGVVFGEPRVRRYGDGTFFALRLGRCLGGCFAWGCGGLDGSA